MSHPFRPILVLLASLLLGFGSAAAQPPEAQKENFRVHRASGPIRVDGELDEGSWHEATPIPVAFEWYPGDGIEPPVATRAFLTYDDRNVYVAFECDDPDPTQIRANLMNRDEINTFVQDDHILIMLDTFNDERRGFQFRVNPLGVQADAIFSQVEGIEDFSWDIIWASAGKITATGYVVEVALPLNQLRFPKSEAEQTWGVDLGRSYPREVRHRIAANRIDRNNNCVLCQINKVTGFAGLEPGLNVEIDPTVTAARTDVREDFPDGPVASGDPDYNPGVTARWGINPSLTLNGTINPDFSQVEADAVQLDVNERFALFYEEKRPFFLEGVDFFTTPITAVYTRTVADPDWGLKLSGKVGSGAGGLFVTRDAINSFQIPSNQGTDQAFLDQTVDAGVVRYRYDLGSTSTIGVLYAGREGDDYHNRVGGIDAFFRLSPKDEIRAQYLHSDTLYPEAVYVPYDQPHEAFDDDAFLVDYSHTAREWFWLAAYEDLGEGFRADSGYVPRVDTRRATGRLARTFWGKPNAWYSQLRFQGTAERIEDQSGHLTDQRFHLVGTYQGPQQSVAQLFVSERKELFVETLYDNLVRWGAYAEIQPGSTIKFSLSVQQGETIDYANNQAADELVVRPQIELKLGRHVNAQLNHIYQNLDVDAGSLSTVNISQLRLVYNFSTRMFLRGILQYRTIDYDPDHFLSPVPDQTESLFTQLLFSYKLNPLTVVFVGYSDNRFGLEQDPLRIDLTQENRTFFVKLGYAWIL